MEIVFVIELVLGLIFVAFTSLLTLQDLHTHYLCGPPLFPDDDAEDGTAPDRVLRD